jgi:copper(I)-binding protein
MHRWLPALVGVALFAGTAAAQTGGIEVKNAWARGTPAGAENGAAYLTLQSPTADRLTGISTPVAKKAELHTMSMDGGVMKMRGLDGIDLPAGQPLMLKPGGMHIMLFGLNQPLRAGETFPLTLQFASGGKREVQVEIEKPGATGPEQQPGGLPMPGHQ